MAELPIFLYTLKAPRGNRPSTCKSFHGVPNLDTAIMCTMYQELLNDYSFMTKEKIKDDTWRRCSLNDTFSYYQWKKEGNHGGKCFPLGIY